MTIIDKNISNAGYQLFLAEIVTKIQHHRVEAVQAVQSISNKLYWKIGELILERQAQYGWGKSIVEKLSVDLSSQIGEGISWSPRNLWFMRQLVSEYSILNQAASELANLKQAASELENTKQLVLQVPWWHNIMILQKVKDRKVREFYL